VTDKARNKAILVAAVLTAAAVVVSLLPMIASTSTDPIRDVRLITRDMTFYLEGSDEPNPTLTFRAGEQVRILLKNEDDGMDHDFSVPGWQVKTKLLTGRGEDALVIQVPAKTGTEVYTCTPHAEIMTGTIRIE
jgi:hypothetical protein